MSYYNENLGNRILELLNYPIVDRCAELGLLFDRCSVRELHDLFPTIVNSIFGISSGGLGWGLRTTSKEGCSQIYDILHNFFLPEGPMFRLCYRLLNDTVKFEFNLELLPHKLGEMIQSGQYPLFYADLLNIDPFRRCVSSLSLNAFDYYILNFVIHGTFPLHKMYPAALQVHNERLKTVYFFLTAEYLCAFLPSSPDSVVMPTNICATVKAPQPMPVQPLQPTRSPKYLKITPVSPYSTSTNQQSTRASESHRTYAWRTESVLHFFIDIWLRFDIDEARDLPSSEFIRCVRILVKQAHTFANCADLDTTSMAGLRKLTQPMMKARIFPFLKSIIARWPLDCSLSLVLELWLSYIQPWRYSFDLQGNSHQNLERIRITPKFEAFIAENLAIYTQVFVQILTRLERLDLTTHRNVVMLHRFVKVFSQPALGQILYNCEERFTASSFNTGQSPRQSSPFYNRSRHADVSSEWDSFRSESLLSDGNYMPMFGVAVKAEIEQFVKTIISSRICVLREMESIRKEIADRYPGVGRIRKMLLKWFEDVSPAEVKIQELSKIPELLDLAAKSLADMFEIELPDLSWEQIPSREGNYSQVNFSLYDNSDYLDITKVSPMQMMNNIANIKPTIDPALLPIQSHEVAFLVRFLHHISSTLNEMYSEEIESVYNRDDFWGRLAKQLLSPPMKAQWFDKSKGISQLCEEELPPRICLRIFGSFKTLLLIGLALVIGRMFCGAPSLGVLFLVLLIFTYLFILAVLS